MMKYDFINKSLLVFSKLIVPLLTTSIEERQIFAKGVCYYLGRLSHLESHLGPHTMIKHAKACRTIVLQYLGGTPVFKSSERISIDKHGLPSMLGPLKEIAIKGKSRPRLLAGLLTILYLTKLIKLPVKADYESIKRDYSGSEVANLHPEIEEVMKSFGLISQKIPLWNACHLSVKKGPSGIPAMLSSLKELSAIAKDDQFLDDLLTLGGQKFSVYLMPLLGALKSYDNITLRKLSVIPDKEGKSRIIGLLDYWSQTVLKPFHDHTMRLLHRFEPMDSTWDQSRFTKRPILDGPYFSFDLSNATDRFPLAFQSYVVEKLYTKEVAEAWKRLLVRLEFASKDGPIVFAVGQPLGAYSSWSVFSLSHHITVGIAARRCGKKLPFTGYYLLGDDIMIADHDVAMEYMKLMEYLGVEISKSKTLVSTSLFSFASRYFLNKEEISPFTFTGLGEAIKAPSTLASFLQTMINHGWSELLGPVMAPGALENITRIYLNQPQTRLADMTRLLIRFPLNGILGVLEISNETLADQFPRSCFESHNRGLLRDYVLLTIRENLINSLPDLFKVFQEWLKKFPPLEEYYKDGPEFESLKRALRRNSAPWANAWDDAHRQTLTKLMILRNYMLGESTEDPLLDKSLEAWLPSFKSINIMPKADAALSERNHVTIVNTNATIIRDALRSSKRYSLQELYHRVANPFEEVD